MGDRVGFGPFSSLRVLQLILNISPVIECIHVGRTDVHIT